MTFAIATLSFRFVEQPVLHRSGWARRPRTSIVLIPIVAVVVVATAFVSVNRSGYDPLEALRRASTNSAHNVTDSTLDVLVIPGAKDEPVVTRLQQRAAGDATLKVTVADPLQCTGGLTATKSGPTCSNWTRAWPELVREHDPDVVLIYADRWSGVALTTLTGGKPASAVDTATAVLNAGFDLLSTRGAHIVWANSVQDFNQAIFFAGHRSTRLCNEWRRNERMCLVSWASHI